jgi:hypothetical protein
MKTEAKIKMCLKLISECRGAKMTIDHFGKAPVCLILQGHTDQRFVNMSRATAIELSKHAKEIEMLGTANKYHFAIDKNTL